MAEETPAEVAVEENPAVSAEEERDRLLLEAERQAARERRKAVDRIIAALDVIEQADGMLLGEARERRAIRGARLMEQRAVGPSLGGLLPQQMESIAREEAARQRGWENEQRSRAAWVADQEDAIKRLSAGQTAENAAAIRAAFRAQKG